MQNTPPWDEGDFNDFCRMLYAVVGQEQSVRFCLIKMFVVWRLIHSLTILFLSAALPVLGEWNHNNVSLGDWNHNNVSLPDNVQ